VQTTATFRLWGSAGLTAAMVTQRLGLQPTEAFEADTPVTRRSSVTRDFSMWILTSSPGIESGTELATHLDRLLTILEPVTQPLWDLIHTGYQANWFCYIASHATEHAAELDRRLLERLLALPGDLWIDVAGDDTDREDTP
jgi:hypothetical protein